MRDALSMATNSPCATRASKADRSDGRSLGKCAWHDPQQPRLVENQPRARATTRRNPATQSLDRVRSFAVDELGSLTCCRWIDRQLIDDREQAALNSRDEADRQTARRMDDRDHGEGGDGLMRARFDLRPNRALQRPADQTGAAATLDRARDGRRDRPQQQRRAQCSIHGNSGMDRSSLTRQATTRCAQREQGGAANGRLNDCQRRKAQHKPTGPSAATMTAACEQRRRLVTMAIGCLTSGIVPRRVSVKVRSKLNACGTVNSIATALSALAARAMADSIADRFNGARRRSRSAQDEMNIDSTVVVPRPDCYCGDRRSTAPTAIELVPQSDRAEQRKRRQYDVHESEPGHRSMASAWIASGGAASSARARSAPLTRA